VDVSRLLLGQKVKVCVLLGPKEDDLKRHFVKDENVCIVSGATITQVAAVIQKADLVITNDSGLLRIANALDKKIVTIFGPVDPLVYSPYPYSRDKHRLIRKDLDCSPCYKKFRLPDCPSDLRCLKEIKAEEVFSAAKELLS
jgi:ADP-heptose:LPS heptosyltransferase